MQSLADMIQKAKSEMQDGIGAVKIKPEMEPEIEPEIAYTLNDLAAIDPVLTGQLLSGITPIGDGLSLYINAKENMFYVYFETHFKGKITIDYGDTSLPMPCDKIIDHIKEIFPGIW